MCALPQRKVGSAVLGHDKGAREARCLLCAAGLDDDLALVLLEIAGNRARFRAHACVAGVGEVARVVKSALPVAVRLVRVAREKNARVVLAAVQPGDAAAVDFRRRARNGLAERDAHVVVALPVGRRGGERDTPLVVIDRRDSDLRTVYRRRQRNAVEAGRVQTELRAFAVADKAVDAPSGQEVYRLQARAAARRRRGNRGRRHIGAVLHALGCPRAPVSAHRTEARAVKQIQHAVHRKRL